MDRSSDPVNKARPYAVLNHPTAPVLTVVCRTCVETIHVTLDARATKTEASCPGCGARINLGASIDMLAASDTKHRARNARAAPAFSEYPAGTPLGKDTGPRPARRPGPETARASLCAATPRDAPYSIAPCDTTPRALPP